jgi:hypothetical protein
MSRSARGRPAPASGVGGFSALVLALLLAGAPACSPTDGSASPTSLAPATSDPASLPTRTTRPPAARYQSFSDPTYGQGENWLCGPDIAENDRCLIGNQDTTVVTADGQATERVSEPVTDPVADCFYVYPTFGRPGVRDKKTGRDTSFEENLVFEEAARLREQCRVFAPLYRLTGSNDSGIAYLEILSAFKVYMARMNRGRPLILFGHAQGAEHLTKLLQEEFDDDADLRGRLVAAYLIGGRVDTATGSRTGGTFRNIPACSSPTETGCVVGWSATSPSTPRDVAARAGEAPAGRTRLCVNPTRLSGGPGLLKAIAPASDDLLRRPVAVSTPFIELPNVLSAECVTNGSVTTLVVRPPAGNPEADARDTAALTANTPGSGLQLAEVSLALGSITDLMVQQVSGLR